MQWFLTLFISVISGAFIVIALHKCRKPKETSQNIPNFSIGEYLERIENVSIRILEEQKRADQRITLWWGVNGIRLNDDGTIEWVKRTSIAENSALHKNQTNKTRLKIPPMPRDMFEELVETSGVIYKFQRRQIKPQRYQIQGAESAQLTVPAGFGINQGAID